MMPLLKRWLWVTLVIGAIIISFAPTPVGRESRPANNDEGWLVPRLAVATGASALAAGLQQSNLWGGQVDAVSAQDDRASQWRLAGITGQTRDRVAMVQFGDDRMMPLRVGEKFPDGTPITEIRENGVCVTLSGKRRFLPLTGQTIAIAW